MISDIAKSVVLRPVVPEDERFLQRVYASTRAHEMAATGWLEVEQIAFLNMQFKLQTQSYQQQFPRADHAIILLDGKAVGRMMVDRTSDEELRGVDIAVLTEYRNSGVGTFLIKQLLDEASTTGRPFRIQVERFNHPVFRLYDRLGFVRTGESDTHIAMEWIPKD